MSFRTHPAQVARIAVFGLPSVRKTFVFGTGVRGAIDGFDRAPALCQSVSEVDCRHPAAKGWVGWRPSRLVYYIPQKRENPRGRTAAGGSPCINEGPCPRT